MKTNIILQSRAEQSRAEQSRAERNYGIDALRIYSMFLVVILHIQGHGGVLEASTGMVKNIAYVLEIAAYCAVDCYGLVSGYVGYSDKPKTFRTTKFLTLWTQVLCYSLGITICAYILKPNVIGEKALIKAAFPIATKQYWYFSSYIAVFLLMPWINRFIRFLDSKTLTKFVLLLASLFSGYCIFSMRLGADPFSLQNGYTTVWLICLYIIGAWMKRCEIEKKMRLLTAWIIIVGCIGITCLVKGILPGILRTGVLMNYLSPTILAMAFSYVIIFAKMKPNQFFKKIIAFFAPAAFGVYLIHEQNLIRGHYISQKFTFIADMPFWFLPFVVIGCALIILIVCLLIEKVRMFVFKILRIDKLILITGNKIDQWLDKIKQKIDESKIL